MAASVAEAIWQRKSHSYALLHIEMNAWQEKFGEVFIGVNRMGI